MGFIAAIVLLPVVTAALWLGPALFVGLIVRKPKASEQWYSLPVFVAVRLTMAAAMLGVVYYFNDDLALWVALIGAIILIVAIPTCFLLALGRAMILRRGSPFYNFWDWARSIPVMVALLAMLSVPIVSHWKQQKLEREAYGYSGRFDHLL